MITMTLLEFYKLWDKEVGGKRLLFGLQEGLSKVWWKYKGEEIYICSYMIIDRKKKCEHCKDKFVCFTNSWGV